jgi:trimeric autotransporter adhesin
MNAIFRTIFNAKTGAYVAVSEVAKTAGKSSAAVSGAPVANAAAATNNVFTLKPLSTSLLAAFGLTLSAFAFANPTGGKVTSGNATINNNGSTTTINQSSNSAVINWQNFSIGSNETVNFVQNSSSSVALNRVTSSEPSVILGNLNANGRVFIVNGNGVVFGKGAQVNVGGLVASTRNISDADFNAGKYNFTGNSSASVVNEGSIQTSNGGYVALLGATVQNNGSISAKLGTVAMAAGDDITLDIVGDGLTSVRIDKGTLNALIENGGLIQANGGQVYLTAQAANQALNSVVNNTGVIQAQTIENKDGKILLLGDMQNGTANVAGTLDASAPTGGNGGFVETSAANVKFSDEVKVTTLAPMGKSGTWLIDPTDFTITNNSAAQTDNNIGSLTLSNNLNGGNITIAAQSSGVGNGDIFVNGPINWSANKLTLNAQRNITVGTSGPMNGGAAGQLAFEFGQSTPAANNNANFTVSAPITLPAGQNFSTKNGSGVGSVSRNYTVITQLGVEGSTTGTDLQGMNLGGFYVLGADIDASASAGWNGGLGFSPIGNGTTGFTGQFDGFLHTVTGLTINRPTQDYVGLFGATGTGSAVRHVGVINSNITGNNYVGALVGQNTVNSRLTYSSGNVTGNNFVGGLYGRNTAFTTISYSTANVSGNDSVGGFVGLNNGLLAATNANISNSYATGNVIGVTNVGGFVGSNEGRMTLNYSTGAVSGITNVGGFAGNNVSNSTNNSALTLNVAANTTGGSSTYSNFYNLNTSGQSTSATGIGLTSSEFTQSAKFTTVGICTAAACPPATLANAPFTGSGAWVFSGQSAPILGAFLRPVVVTLGSSTKEYDGKISTSGATFTSATNSFTPNMSLVLGTATYTGTRGTDVGTYAATGGAGLYSTQQGYSFSYATSGNQVITKKTLTASVTAPNKVYDSTTTANAVVNLNGLATGETLNIANTATFNTADVTTANTVTINSLTLSDGTGKISNYSTVAPGQTVSANITPKELTATTTANNKVYDGTTAATANIVISGTIGGQTLGNSITANFNTPDVATANTVTVNTTLTDGTGKASNYSLAPQTASANITPKSITGVATANNKVYDGNTTATVQLTLNGLVGSETLNNTAVASFNSKDVATASSVTVDSLALSDGSGKASNYNLTSYTGQVSSANITPKALSVFANASKVYDGTTSASPALSLNGLVGSETLGTSFTSASFNSKDVATANAVNVSGISLSNGTGNLANYNLASNSATGSGTITPKALSATAVANNKVYDGNTDANAQLTLNGLITGETLNSTNSASFNSKDVTSATTVTVSSVTLADTATGKASNYSLSAGQTASANITPKALTGTAAASNKVYDGNTSATASLVLNGLVGSETLGSTYTATFNSKDVATANTVTINNLAIANGTGLASNYSLPPIGSQTVSAQITRKALTTSATANNKVYDGSTSATAQLSLNGLVGGETLNTTFNANFNSKDVATASTVNLTGISLSNNTGDAGNYSLASSTAGANANITPKALTATATANSKVYDGNTSAAAQLTLNGLVTGEALTNTNTASFNSKDVATANTVTVSSVTLADTATGKASNYSLSAGQTAAATISPKALAAAATANSKVYDGNTSATAQLALSGLVTGETLTNTNTASFNSKDVATANTVTVNSVTLADTATGKAGNYSLNAGQTAAATITPKALTATATASDKVFDGNNTATAQLSLAGLVGTETLGVSNTATFNSSDPATANTVTVNTVALSDATGKAGNYSLAAGQTATAKITPVTATAPVTPPVTTPVIPPVTPPTVTPPVAVTPAPKLTAETIQVFVTLGKNNPSQIQNKDVDTQQESEELLLALNDKSNDFNTILQKNPTAAGATVSNASDEEERVKIKQPSINNLTIVSTGLRLPSVK